MAEYKDSYVAQIVKAYYTVQSHVDGAELAIKLRDFNKETIRKSTIYVYKKFIPTLRQAPTNLRRILALGQLEKKIDSLLREYSTQTS